MATHRDDLFSQAMNAAKEGRGHLLGSLRSVGGKGAVSMQDRFDTDVDDLWSQ